MPPSRSSAAAEFLARKREQTNEGRVLPYVPTKTTNPPRPRTLESYYNTASETMTIRFRDGTLINYYNVPQNVWRNYRRSASPGRFINRVLNGYNYGPA